MGVEAAMRRRGARAGEPPDPIDERNRELLALARRHRVKVAEREDGEQVMLVRGGEDDHIGKWSRDTYYLLACRPHRHRLARDISSVVAGAEVRMSDIEVLILIPEPEMAHLLARTYPWLKLKRRRSAGSATHLVKFRF